MATSNHPTNINAHSASANNNIPTNQGNSASARNFNQPQQQNNSRQGHNPFPSANNSQYLDPRLMLDMFIYDYMLKSKYNAPAQAFLEASKLDQIKIKIPFDTPTSFLRQWFSVFWELFKTKGTRPVPFDARKFSDYTRKCVTNALSSFSKTNGLAAAHMAQQQMQTSINAPINTNTNVSSNAPMRQNNIPQNPISNSEAEIKKSRSKTQRSNSSSAKGPSPGQQNAVNPNKPTSNNPRSRTNSDAQNTRTVRPPTSISLPPNPLSTVAKPTQQPHVQQRPTNHQSPHVQYPSQPVNANMYPAQPGNNAIPNIDYNLMLTAQNANANTNRPQNPSQAQYMQQRSRQMMIASQNSNLQQQHIQYMTPQINRQQNIPLNAQNVYNANNEINPAMINNTRMMQMYAQTQGQATQQQQNITMQQVKDTASMARRQVIEQQNSNSGGGADNSKRMRIESQSPHTQFSNHPYQNPQSMEQPLQQYTPQQQQSMYYQAQQRMMQQGGHPQQQYNNQQFQPQQAHPNYLNVQNRPTQQTSQRSQPQPNTNQQQQYKSNPQQTSQANDVGNKANEQKKQENSHTQQGNGSSGYSNMYQSPSQVPNPAQNGQGNNNNTNEFDDASNALLADFNRYINTDDLDSYYSYGQNQQGNNDKNGDNPSADTLGSLMGGEPFDKTEFYQ